ncbi:MAG: class I SAM-dependent methyltransferase [Bryobacteraceae bacterium]
MKPAKSSFDHFAESYDELLRDPIRARFCADGNRFFHLRKCELIRDYYRRRGIDTRGLAMLDLGCGKGELVKLLRGDFAEAAGCDPSAQMLESGRFAASGIAVRVQTAATGIPFESARFDLVTAVCVYHHVEPGMRDLLTAEAHRVLKPGGVFAIIEHNPYNPATRLIVSRTPVDADAELLTPAATRGLFRRSGFQVTEQRYFLYFPERVYARLRGLERLLGRVPLGGQYAVFGS